MGREDRSVSRSRSRSRSPRRKEKKKDKKKSKSKRKDKKHKEEKKDKPNRAPAADGGQDSMSVVETNRIRISLGLEPLAAPDGAAKAQKREDDKARQEDARKAKENDEIRKDLVKRRRDRQLKAKTEGETLGEQYSDVTGGSAADWVKRSRKIGKTKAAAGLRAALLAEQEAAASTEGEYDSAALKGLKVRHGAEAFESGSTVIMTLKDQNILVGENTEISENLEEDTLENVNMVDQERTDKNLEIKSQKVIYDATGEEADTLLPQYNDEKEKEGMRLEGDEDARLETIRSKLKKAAAKPMVSKKDQFKQGKTEYDLAFSTGVGSDYLPTQPAKFKKRRKKVKKTGDGRKKKEKFTLPEPSAEERAKDHSSRSASRKDALESERNVAGKMARDQNYLKALQKAEKDSARMMDAASQKEVEEAFEDEEDAALQSSLDRARRLKKDKKGKSKMKKEDEDYQDPIKKLAEKLKKMKEEKEDEDEDEAMETPEDKDKALGATVFTATTEFCRGLQDTVDKEKDKQDVQQKFGFEAVKADDKEKDDKKKRDFDPETEQMNEDEDEDDSDEEKEEYTNEPLVNAGASSALELMRVRGLLKQKIQQVGRANDGQLELEDAGSNISIVHLDEHGRPMKPKEAFRKLSHKFHGRGPSAQKQEKNLKKLREEVRRKQNLSKNKSLTMNKLKNHQNQFKEAHVVLEGEGAHKDGPSNKKKKKGMAGKRKRN